MKTKLEKLISDLNRKTPNGIAKFLEQNKIVGISHPNSCPINGYLANKLKINRLKISVGPSYIICDKNKKTIKTPSNVSRFITRFDLDYYPKIKI